MAIKLYGFPMSPNSRRVQLGLLELELPFEYVQVNLMEGAHKSPEYLRLNPNGKVPTLVEDDVVLWESHAILEYLADRYPAKRLGAESPRERGEIGKWLYLNAAHFGPAMAAVFAHTIRLPEEQRIAKLAENGRAEVTRVMGVLEAALAAGDHLALGRQTIADVSFAPSFAFAPMLGFDLAAFPRLAAWIERQKARPAFVKLG